MKLEPAVILAPVLGKPITMLCARDTERREKRKTMQDVNFIVVAR